MGEDGFTPDVRDHGVAFPPACYRIRMRQTEYEFPPHRNLREVLGPLGPPRASLDSTEHVISPTAGDPLVSQKVDREIHPDLETLVPEALHEDLCMICQDAARQFVMEVCGHLGVCSDCRTLLYRHQLQQKKGREVKDVDIHWAHIFRTLKILCPCCRTPTKTLLQDEYRGKFFHC